MKLEFETKQNTHLRRRLKATLKGHFPQTSKKVNRAVKARTIVDLAIRNQPQKIFLVQL